jgi:aryl-alcohol dehydrogenase-like predicted oxidoreductase
VIAYSPMASGLLTGKYNRQKVAALPPTDWRVTKNEYFREPSLTLNLEMVESLRPIAERNNHSLGELAVAWVLRRPEVTAAIVGARRPDQIAETAMAGDWTLSTDEQYAIEKILEGRQAKE